MLNIIIHILIIFFCIIAMELIAIISHKYIMHGPGWFLHKSHHQKHKNIFELNDIYFIFFSTPSIFSIIFGMLESNYILLSIGIGIMLYGLIYILLHDVVVHQRFGIKINIKKYSYLNKIKRSHLKHHSNKNKENSTNFGFISYL